MLIIPYIIIRATISLSSIHLVLGYIFKCKWINIIIYKFLFFYFFFFQHLLTYNSGWKRQVMCDYLQHPIHIIPLYITCNKIMRQLPLYITCNKGMRQLSLNITCNKVMRQLPLYRTCNKVMRQLPLYMTCNKVMR